MSSPESRSGDLRFRLDPPRTTEGQAREDHGADERRPEERVGLGRPGARVGADELDLELLRLDRRNLASVLRQATGVVAPRAPQYGVWAGYPLPPQSTRLWRRRARAVLRSVGSPVAATPAAGWVSQLLARPIDGWPGVSRVAQLARRVEDSEFARVCQGYALLCEGQAGRARQVFEGIEARVRVMRHAWRVHEGLALALERLGLPQEALEQAERAAEDPRRGVSAVAEALRLCLLVGTPARARRAAARLDMLVEPRSPAFASALGRLRLRARVLGGELPRDPALVALVQELAAEARTPSGRIAALLLSLR